MNPLIFVVLHIFYLPASVPVEGDINGANRREQVIKFDTRDELIDYMKTNCSEILPDDEKPCIAYEARQFDVESTD